MPVMEDLLAARLQMAVSLGFHIIFACFIHYIFSLCSFFPLIGIIALFLPDLSKEIG